MLVLARRVGEQIVIGADVTVTVLRVDGKTVRLGVEAPPDTSVDRPEIRQRKERGDEARVEAA